MFFRLFLVLKILVVSMYFTSLVAWPALAIAASPKTAPDIQSSHTNVQSSKKILVFGDSLSAAYGIPQQQGWTALLQKKFTQQNLHYEVVNASISGETTSGGLSRLDAALKQTQPAIVILELGANDGLRGLPINQMHANLNSMIQKCKKAGAKVLLVGMKIPPNYGAKYTASFSETYYKLSLQHKVPLVPFMLENVAAKPSLIQPDGLHPNVLGQPIVLDNIWPQLKAFIKK